MAAAATSLLSAACSRPLSRAASGVVAKVARGFQVFRIDGFSLTNYLPAGQSIASPQFAVGGRNWCIDYYPNGTDPSCNSSGSISLFLRLSCHHVHNRERVRAQYTFSLLDAAGNAAFELPSGDDIFLCPGRNPHQYTYSAREPEPVDDPVSGYEEFIKREELERRRHSLLVDDSLAVRCDVAVVKMEAISVAPKEHNNNNNGRWHVCDGYYTDWADGAPHEARPWRRWQLDDAEYVRRCLARR